MIIGPFWLVNENTWLRFNLTANNPIEVQVATENTALPGVKSEWQTLGDIKGPWIVWDRDPQNPRLRCFAMNPKNQLIATDWTQNKFQLLLITSYAADGSSTMGPENRSTQALGIPKPDYTPPDAFPLTPTELNTARQNIVVESQTCDFTEAQCGILNDYFDQLMIDIGSQASFIEHHTAVLKALGDKELFDRFAGLTDLDQTFSLNPDNNKDIRAQLYWRKLDYFVARTVAYFNKLRDIAGLPQLPQAQLVKDTLQTRMNNNPANLAIYKSAIAQAVTNYQNWYQGTAPDARGIGGWFTFFRHGKAGQVRATAFNLKIQGLDDLRTIKSEIEALLKDPKTRFNRHSFASFLLDELQKISSPYSKLEMKENLYDEVVVRGRTFG